MSIIENIVIENVNDDETFNENIADISVYKGLSDNDTYINSALTYRHEHDNIPLNLINDKASPVTNFKFISANVMSYVMSDGVVDNVNPFFAYSQCMTKIFDIDTVEIDPSLKSFNYSDNFRNIQLGAAASNYTVYSPIVGGWQHDQNNMTTVYYDDMQSKYYTYMAVPFNTYVLPKSMDDIPKYVNKYFGIYDGLFITFLSFLHENKYRPNSTLKRINGIMHKCIDDYVHSIRKHNTQELRNEAFRHKYNLPGFSMDYTTYKSKTRGNESILDKVRSLIVYYLKNISAYPQINLVDTVLPEGIANGNTIINDPEFNVTIRDITELPRKENDKPNKTRYRCCLILQSKQNPSIRMLANNIFTYDSIRKSVYYMYSTYIRFDYTFGNHVIDILFKPGKFDGPNTPMFYNVNVLKPGVKTNLTNPVYRFIHSDEFYDSVEVTPEKVEKSMSRIGLLYHMFAFLCGDTWEDDLHIDDYYSLVLYKKYEQEMMSGPLPLPRVVCNENENDAYMPIQQMDRKYENDTKMHVKILTKLVNMGLCEEEMHPKYIWKFSYFYNIDIKALLATIRKE